MRRARHDINAQPPHLYISEGEKEMKKDLSFFYSLERKVTFLYIPHISSISAYNNTAIWSIT